MKKCNLRRAVVVLLGIILPAANIRAAEFTFTIDPSQSALALSGGTLSGGGAPLEIEEQSPGSLVAPYVGSVMVDITATSIEFRGGLLDAQVTGNYQPLGTSGDYGFQADAGSILIGSMVGAVREAQFGMTSGPLSVTPTATGFDFDVAGSTVTGSAGVVNFGGVGMILGALDGVSETLVDASSTSVSGMGGSLATFSSDGAVETLTLPLSIFYQGFASAGQVDLMLEGTIVATRQVPEPSVFGMVLLGALILGKRRG